MAKNRMINTHFWDDSYIIDLDPIQKLVFIYALTNPLTSICGIYEIALKRMAFDTGIDKDMIVKIFARFEADGKMIYKNGWIAIKNFIKHQAANSNIDKGIEEAMKEVPEALRDWVMKPFESLSKPSEAFQSLSNPSNYSNPNPNLNYNLKETKKDVICESSKENESADKSASCVSEIVEYLNDKCNKNYKAKSKGVIKYIIARYNEGYSIEDFKKVIDTKSLEWINTDMDKFLRPETLFSSAHFESYLNQQPRAKPEELTPAQLAAEWARKNRKTIDGG